MSKACNALETAWLSPHRTIAWFSSGSNKIQLNSYLDLNSTRIEAICLLHPLNQLFRMLLGRTCHRSWILCELQAPGRSDERSICAFEKRNEKLFCISSSEVNMSFEIHPKSTITSISVNYRVLMYPITLTLSFLNPESDRRTSIYTEPTCTSRETRRCRSSEKECFSRKIRSR